MILRQWDLELSLYYKEFLSLNIYLFAIHQHILSYRLNWITYQLHSSPHFINTLNNTCHHYKYNHYNHWNWVVRHFIFVSLQPFFIHFFSFLFLFINRDFVFLNTKIIKDQKPFTTHSRQDFLKLLKEVSKYHPLNDNSTIWNFWQGNLKFLIILTYLVCQNQWIQLFRELLN